MKLRGDDTIGAISTALGEGAISIVRVSGPGAFTLIDPIFRGKHRLSESPGYTIRHGYLAAPGGDLLDEVLVSVFRAPHSYTGEDLLEISCHGGTVMAKQVLELVLLQGVRQADPGEFTKRAFLNGKLDLTQAEAVAGIISARTRKSIHASLDQLRGKLSECVDTIKRELLDICALLELELDFADEGVEIANKTVISGQLDMVLARIQTLVQSYTEGKVHREGTTVAIVGRPNAGKSSIFNALLNTDRSIVTHVAGTTRDTIEESIQVDGVLFTLIDTAGIRDSVDPAEIEGIRRTEALLETSDIILGVVDCTDEQNGMSAMEKVLSPLRQKSLIVLNKIDLREDSNPARPLPPRTLAVSSKSGAGIPELKEALSRLIEHVGIPPSDIQIVSFRHTEALMASAGSLKAALSSLNEHVSTELAAADIRMALNFLSEITGEVTTDDILNRIFSSFCIGK